MKNLLPCVALVLLAATLGACRQPTPAVDYAGPVADWPATTGSPGGGRFSKATQLTPDNVAALEPAWVYRTGDQRGPGEVEIEFADGRRIPGLSSAWQMTPLLVNDTLYGCSAFNTVFALDPATGTEKWRHDPEVDTDRELMVNCRGVASWQDPAAAGHTCSHRIFTATMDGRLLALDGASGEPCRDFGDGGTVDLRVGLGEYAEHEYSSLSPPAVLGDAIILGAKVLDRVHNDMPSGVVRAFDARSGAQLWYWDPIPPGQQPRVDDEGRPLYRRGTTNVWSLIAVDPEHKLVFLPTGNTSTDFYGALRDNLDYWSSSVVALHGDTGKVAWHFQLVHHDIWDYDTPAQPTLFDFHRDGEVIPALAQATKMGHLFLLNRLTGEPLFPVEERPVPQHFAVPGEYLSPTQPFPTRPQPLHPARLAPEDAWGFTFWDQGACRKKIEGLRNEGIFTPPSLQGSLFYPSDFGGNNWDTPAIDPTRNIAILNSRRVPAELKLVPRDQCPADAMSPQLGTPYCVEINPLMSPLGVPCNAPPWGVLAAVDLDTGEALWEVPLGTLEELAPWPFSRIQGPPNIGGPMVTASGLIFIAGTPDQYLRALDITSGRELWRGKLPTGGHANPMSYRAGPDQKQYVVIAAGGHFGMARYGQEPGDYLLAFALPDR